MVWCVFYDAFDLYDRKVLGVAGVCAFIVRDVCPRTVLPQ